MAVFAENKGDGLKIYAQNLVDDTVGTEHFHTTSFFLANPVEDEMVITCNFSIENILVFNVQGQRIFSSKYQNESTVSINTQSWDNGIYLMDIFTDKGAKKSIKLLK